MRLIAQAALVLDAKLALSERFMNKGGMHGRFPTIPTG
jgi:hypothetical protein